MPHSGSRDSALCGIAQSCDSALCGTARIRDSLLCGIARSRFSALNLIEYLREFESICKTVLGHESGDPGVQFNEKIRGSKILWYCPFNQGPRTDVLLQKTEGWKSRNTVPLASRLKYEFLISLDMHPIFKMTAEFYLFQEFMLPVLVQKKSENPTRFNKEYPAFLKMPKCFPSSKLRTLKN
jgi:hypothetical protein